MKLYRVTAAGRSWTMSAPNIQAASQFVKHCPSVRLRSLRSYSLDIEGLPPLTAGVEIATGAMLDAWAAIPIMSPADRAALYFAPERYRK